MVKGFMERKADGKVAKDILEIRRELDVLEAGDFKDRDILSVIDEGIIPAAIEIAEEYGTQSRFSVKSRTEDIDNPELVCCNACTKWTGATASWGDCKERRVIEGLQADPPISTHQNFGCKYFEARE